ncbi:MAG: hypothetical protein AAFO99_16710 [Bacteroidota bacterium]
MKNGSSENKTTEKLRSQLKTIKSTTGMLIGGFDRFIRTGYLWISG